MAKYLQRGLGEVYGREVEEYNNRDTIRETLEEMASSPQPEEPPAEETAQEEKLELIPGETLIGVISDGNVSGEYRERIEEARYRSTGRACLSMVPARSACFRDTRR